MTSPSSPAIELATPWRRYWARFLDITIFSAVIGVALGLIMPSLLAPDGPLYTPVGEQLVGWIILPVVMMADAVVMGLFGTTPGKAIAGVRVSGIEGARPTVGQAMRRNFQLWWYGLGTGFPLITLFTLIASYRKAARGEPLRWEEATGLRSYGKGTGARTVVTMLVCVGLYAALFAIDAGDQEAGQRYIGTSTEPDPGWIESELQLAAREINQDAPMQVDEYTQLDGAVAGPGQMLTYRYTLIDTDLEEITAADLQDFENTMTEILRTNTCDDPATRGLLDADVKLVFEYSDSYGSFVSRFEVQGQDCLQ